MKKALKNDLLLRVLRQEQAERIPVWLMRQAGRYLPEYQVLRARYSFFERCETPELVAEITAQPVEIIGVDAAILFSDILVVPKAMGADLELVENKGPIFKAPLRSLSAVRALKKIDASVDLSFVMEGIAATLERLAKRVPLIGFAGAPWTIFCYMVQGSGSKTFDIAKTFAYTQTEATELLLQKITDATIDYLKAQVRAGVEVLQLFDTWASVLSAADFAIYSLPYIRKIIEAVRSLCPTIIFAKGAWHALADLERLAPGAIGLDWCCPPEYACAAVPKSVLQGNLDPSILTADKATIRTQTRRMLAGFSHRPYIANLGHGLLPHTPVANVRYFVETVQNFKL